MPLTGDLGVPPSFGLLGYHARRWSSDFLRSLHGNLVEGLGGFWREFWWGPFPGPREDALLSQNLWMCT